MILVAVSLLLVSTASAEPVGDAFDSIVSSLSDFVDYISSLFSFGLFSALSGISEDSLDGYNPRLGDCDADSSGDIIGCQAKEPNLRDTYSRGWSRGDTFRVVVSNLEIGDDNHAPQAYYLYKNGYVSSSVDSEDRSRFSQLHLNHGDFNWDSSIQSSLNQGSTCSMDMDLGSPGDFSFTYRKDGQEFTEYYNDEPDSNEEPAERLMSPVNVEARETIVEDEFVICEFKVEDVLDNTRHGGEFVSWSGRYPTFEGGNDGGSVSNVNVDFNTPPEIDSVQSPARVNVTEAFTVRVQASDIESGSSLNYYWSNDVRGQTSSYSFTETGLKTFSVNVSDGVSTVSETVSVDVVDERVDDSTKENQEKKDSSEEVDDTDSGTTDPSGGDDETSELNAFENLFYSVIGFFGGLI